MSWENKMPKRIGLIQTSGIGDIIIAIPIADFFIQRGYDVFWPIHEHFFPAFQQAKPEINFLAVTKGTDDMFEIPMSILQKHDCEKVFILYSYLKSAEVYNKTFLRSLKFDEYKYAIAGVPFANKWNLVLHRDHERELALYNRLEITKPYICIHRKGSGFQPNISLPDSFHNDYQIIEVEPITNNPFDWIYTFQNAAKLVFIDSCFSNRVEQLNFTNEKYLIFRSEVSFTPVMKNGWQFMGVPSDSLNMTTE